MRRMIGSLVILLFGLVFGVFIHVLGASGPPVDFQAVQYELHRLDGPRTYDGPPLTLAGAVDEALAKNPGLIALRKQFDAARHRPGQERFLMPPTFEAQIWQWPINTLNPANTNMYMLMMNQDLSGRAICELGGNDW